MILNRMSVKDNFGSNHFSSLTMPKFKGHVKVTLHNVYNKKNEVFEGDNIITNAVADIFANCYLNSLDAGSMLPLWEKWFGGILCFASAHPLNNGVLDPADYYPQADSANHLTAHAGQTAIDVDHDDDMTRGNPTKSAYIKTGNSIKQVWEWGTTHGNGIISALSLTHSDVGSYGLGNNGYHFKNSFQPFALIGNLSDAYASVNSIQNIFAMYDHNHSLWFCIGDGTTDSTTGEGFYNGHTSFQTHKLTVFIRRLPYFKTCLFDEMTVIEGDDYTRKFTVELSDFYLYNQPSYFFDYENKKLWIFSNTTRATDGYNAQTYSDTTVNYAIIDCETGTIDSEGTIVSDNSDLAPVAMEKYPNRSIATDTSRFRNANILKVGNYVYLPTTSGVDWGSGTGRISKFNVSGFKKININNQSDQTLLSMNEVQDQFKSSMIGGGLIVNSGRVINGDTGFTCVSQLSEAEAIPSYAIHDPYSVSSVATYLGAGNSTGNQPRYILANKCVLTSKYNLNPMQKTSSTSMTVEYTLQEV